MLSFFLTSQHFVSTNKSSFISSIVRGLIYVSIVFFSSRSFAFLPFCFATSNHHYRVLLSLFETVKKNEKDKIILSLKQETDSERERGWVMMILMHHSGYLVSNNWKWTFYTKHRHVRIKKKRKLFANINRMSLLTCYVLFFSSSFSFFSLHHACAYIHIRFYSSVFWQNDRLRTSLMD